MFAKCRMHSTWDLNPNIWILKLDYLKKCTSSRLLHINCGLGIWISASHSNLCIGLINVSSLLMSTALRIYDLLTYSWHAFIINSTKCYSHTLVVYSKIWSGNQLYYFKLIFHNFLCLFHIFYWFALHIFDLTSVSIFYIFWNYQAIIVTGA